VWPENWRAFQLFVSLETQWRVIPGGYVGLDYNVLYKKMDRLGLSPAEYDQLEEDIQLMELEALSHINKKPEAP